MNVVIIKVAIVVIIYANINSDNKQLDNQKKRSEKRLIFIPKASIADSRIYDSASVRRKSTLVSGLLRISYTKSNVCEYFLVN